MDDTVIIYGASWCPDCRRAKRFLGDQRIAYEWHDIEVDPDGVDVVQQRNNGNNVIPTIIFPDGSHLSEPSNEELAEKLGIQRMAMMHVYDLVIVGGGPAGLTTSIYAARENLETLVIDAGSLKPPTVSRPPALCSIQSRSESSPPLARSANEGKRGQTKIAR